MATLAPPAAWRPSLEHSLAPRYLALAELVARDLGRGILRAGDRLPPQRELAEALGVNLATVTRGIAEAERRGLLRAEAGRGTFVTDPSQHLRRPGPVDLTINTPPEPDSIDLGRKYSEAAARLLRGTGGAALLRYPDLGGSMDDREAGASWIATRGLSVTADHLVLTHGADHAIQLGLSVLAVPERRRVVVESLSYPGFRTIAGMLGLDVSTVECDEEGPVPDSLDAIATREPVVFCATPTIHNPTGRSFSTRRMDQLLELAARRDVRILEDDVYGFLAEAPEPPIASRAPERALYITSFSKTFAAGLRLGYLAAASDRWAEVVASASRATTLTPVPLASAVATVWIHDGVAADALRAVRLELRERNRIADEALGDALARSEPESPPRWLRLPDGWRRGEFTERARRAGVLVRTSDAFAAGREPPEAVRVSISAAASASVLRTTLLKLASLLREPHDRACAVV